MADDPYAAVAVKEPPKVDPYASAAVKPTTDPYASVAVKEPSTPKVPVPGSDPYASVSKPNFAGKLAPEIEASPLASQIYSTLSPYGLTAADVTSVVSGPHVKGSAHFDHRAIDVGSVGGKSVGANPETFAFISNAIQHGGLQRIGSTAAIVNNLKIRQLAAKYNVDLFTDEGTGPHLHLQVAPRSDTTEADFRNKSFTKARATDPYAVVSKPDPYAEAAKLQAKAATIGNPMEDPAAAQEANAADGSGKRVFSALNQIAAHQELPFVLYNAHLRDTEKDGSTKSITELLKNPNSNVSKAWKLYTKSAPEAMDEYGYGSPKQNRFMAKNFSDSLEGKFSDFMNHHAGTNAAVTTIVELFNPMSIAEGEVLGRGVGAVRAIKGVDKAAQGAAKGVGLGSPLADIEKRAGPQGTQWAKGLIASVKHEDNEAARMNVSMFGDLTNEEQREVIRLSQGLKPNPEFFKKYNLLMKRANDLRVDIGHVTLEQTRTSLLRKERWNKERTKKTDPGQVYNTATYFPMSKAYDFGTEHELWSELRGSGAPGGGTTKNRPKEFDNLDESIKSGKLDKDFSPPENYLNWRRQRMQSVAFEDAMALAPESLARRATSVKNVEVPITQPKGSERLFRGNLIGGPDTANLRRPKGMLEIMNPKAFSKEPPKAAPFYFFTESPEAAKRYANSDMAALKKIKDSDAYSEQLRQSANPDYKVKSPEELEQQARQVFEYSHGRPPLEGRVDQYYVSPKKTLDLSKFGPKPLYEDLVDHLQEIHDPGWEDRFKAMSPEEKAAWGRTPGNHVEGVFYPQNKGVGADEQYLPVWRLMRNLDSEDDTAHLFHDWLKSKGYDAVKYAENGTVHTAMLDKSLYIDRNATKTVMRRTKNDKTGYVRLADHLPMQKIMSPSMRRMMIAPELYTFFSENGSFRKFVDGTGTTLPGEAETAGGRFINVMRSLALANPLFHPAINVAGNDAVQRGLNPKLGGAVWEAGGYVRNAAKAVALQLGIVKPEKFYKSAQDYQAWMDRALKVGATAEFGKSRTTMLGGSRAQVMTEPPKTWAARLDKAFTKANDWNMERTFGEKGEKAFSVQLFKDAVEKGKLKDHDAARLVNEALNDYYNFDPKNKATQAFLFMPWLKTNTKLWASVMLKKPQYLGSIQHGIRNQNLQQQDPALDAPFAAPDFRLDLGQSPTNNPEYWTPPSVFKDSAKFLNMGKDVMTGDPTDFMRTGESLLDSRSNVFAKIAIDAGFTTAASMHGDLKGPENDFHLMYNPKAPKGVQLQELGRYLVGAALPVPLVHFMVQDAMRKGLDAKGVLTGVMSAGGSGFFSEGLTQDQQYDAGKARKQYLKSYYQWQNNKDDQTLNEAWSSYMDRLKEVGILK